MKKQAESWLEAARYDLLVIDEILDNEDLTQMVAFHSQQAIEKCFKAVLEENDSKIPRSHDLITSFHSVQNFVQIELDYEILKEINDLYVDSRYPSDIGLLPEGKPSRATAGKMSELARKIYKDAKEKLV